ncbi:MAG: hypothetical protein Q8Q48_02080 [Candidatus Staskawiczbacteria bacterium]|nr:hypothetical protein [Candidatus Staskawiczbacteria bacterium]
MPEEFKTSQETEKPNDITEAEKSVSSLFDSHKNGADRVTEILTKINPILESGLFDKDGITDALNQCADIEDRGEFIKRTTAILQPLIELRRQDPKVFRKLATPIEGHGQHEKFIDINDVLSYNEIGEEGRKSLLIHLPITEEKKERLGLTGIGRLFEQGMQDLAKIAKEREDVVKIEATSKLVKKYKRLMENLGFTVTGPINEDLRLEHFSNEKPEEVWHSEISKEDFLNKYLEEK